MVWNQYFVNICKITVSQSNIDNSIGTNVKVSKEMNKISN